MKFFLRPAILMAVLTGACTPPSVPAPKPPSNEKTAPNEPTTPDEDDPPPTWPGPASTPPTVEVPRTACLEKGATVAPDARVLRGTFATTCAGCHGVAGDGVGKFPALHQDKGIEAFTKIVREGKQGTAGVMPSFASAHVSDADLVGMYAALVNKPVTVDATIGCTGKRALTAAEIEAAFQRGLEAWRAPDHEGAACASCHGVMPADLAFIGYDDATIFRRALKHIDDATTRRVIDFVHAIRAKYGISTSREFLAFRPFQPGGQPLPGATAADRDHEFGRNVAQVVPTLFDGVVDTKDKARHARDELLKINPRTFPIGVPLNRWTEDQHHGAEHATFNDWIPDRPHVAKDDAARKALYALHDRYLADPTWQNAFAIQDAQDSLAPLTGVDAGFARGMYRFKYRSVLFAQHHFLQEMSGGATLARMSAAPFPGRNSVWDLADLARVSSNVSFATDCQGRWNGCLGLPPDAVAAIDPSLDAGAELDRLKLSWFWAGWFVDTTLYFTAGSNSTKVSEYFTESLYENGYYDHVVYHRIRKNLAVAYEVEQKIDDPAGQPGIDHPWAHTYRYYMGYGRGIDADKLPRDAASKALYLAFAGNTLRMMILLATEHIERTKQVAQREPMLVAYDPDTSPFAQWVRVHSDDPARDRALVDAYRRAVQAACERRPLAYKEAPYPGHCTAR